MKYDVWTTKDGRYIPVKEMKDLHLLHTIRAIEEGMVLPPIDLFDEGGFGPHDLGLIQVQVTRDEAREAWLTVLKGEALQRGLDWSKPPSKRINLLDFVFDELEANGWKGGTPRTWKELVRVQLSKNNIPCPEIDVSNLDGKVTYLHWQTGQGIGTPVEKVA